MTTSTIASPKEWPQEIADAYNPVRVLGSGGFASVVLARKTNQDQPLSSCDDEPIPIPNKVAIKVVGCNDGTGNHEEAALYARREVELLEQISHIGIVRLFHSWERRVREEEEEELADDPAKEESWPSDKSPTAGVLVLEYLKGPTVEKLLKHGGALSTAFARVVIAQVMDAMAYLHYRAVVHRDIKPDNIMITGALSSDPFIWDNEKNDETQHGIDKSPEEWKRLCFKYKATIIDFGFARALTPGDLEESTTETMMKSMQFIKPGYYDQYEDDLDNSRHQKKSSGGLRKLFGSNSNKSLCDLDESVRSNGSVSHKMKRVMSTLGNRNYAAPEIVEKVRPFTTQEKSKESKKALLQRRVSKTTRTISKFVADYGLLVDSYSMGHTIRYMMTGVEPGSSVDEVIKKQQRSKKAGKVLKMVGLKKKPKKGDLRKPLYRSLKDAPGHVYLLVQELTQLQPQNRLSIRKARRTYPWISNVLAFQKHSGKGSETTNTNSLAHISEEQVHTLDETRYLPLATPNPASVVSTRSSCESTSHPTGRTQTEKTMIGSLSASDVSNNVAVDGDDVGTMDVHDEGIIMF